FAEYRPRLLTRFAVDALTNALAGKALPSPPPLLAPLANASSYVGRYAGPAGAFEVRAGKPLTIVSDGGTAPLELVADDVFRTTHPRFSKQSILFDRKGTGVQFASWGPDTFVREGSGGRITPSDPALAQLAGRYVNDNPWYGAAPVFERGGKLWIGTETPLTRTGDNLWRVGKKDWS